MRNQRVFDEDSHKKLHMECDKCYIEKKMRSNIGQMRVTRKAYIEIVDGE